MQGEFQLALGHKINTICDRFSGYETNTRND